MKNFSKVKESTNNEIKKLLSAKNQMQIALDKIEKEYQDIIMYLDDETLQEELQEKYKSAKDCNEKAMKRLGNMASLKKKMLNYMMLVNACENQVSDIQSEMKLKNDIYDEIKLKCLENISNQSNYENEVVDTYYSVCNDTFNDY